VKMKLLALMLLASGSVPGQVSFGISIGPPPPPPPPVYYARPVAPGPGFVWVDGYWVPARGHYRWRNGYWVRPPFVGARWIGPRYEHGRYYRGYWGHHRW